MQTIAVVGRVALALLQHLLVLARLCLEDPSSASIRGMRFLDASLFFAGLSKAGLQRSSLCYQYEHWSRSGEKSPPPSTVVALASCV
jgi:hypothetical protein